MMEFNFCQYMGNNIEWIAPLIASIIIPLSAIYIANRHTEKQIKNQNIENHRPFIILKGIEYNYVDNEKHPVYTISLLEDNTSEHRPIALIIKNIGYGIAKDIVFKEMPNQKIALKYESPFPFNLGSNDEELVILNVPDSHKVEELKYSFKVFYFDLYHIQYPDEIKLNINLPSDGTYPR